MRHLPLVVNVAMESITLDVSALPAEALAQRAGTIGYEILTSLGARHARRYSCG